MRIRTVLLAGGDDEARRTYRTALEGSDYAVIEARNGSEACEVLKQCRPDVVVSTGALATPDGSTLAQVVKNAPETRNTKVVSMISSDASADEAAAVTAGADVVLSPATTAGDLLAQIVLLTD